MLQARFLVMLMLIWRGILAPAIAADPQRATFDGVVDSYDQTNRLILFLEQHQQQPVYLSLRGIWPFVSYDRSTCGPVFWQTPPDAESNDYFISGTQLCLRMMLAITLASLPKITLLAPNATSFKASMRRFCFKAPFSLQARLTGDDWGSGPSA